jgi:hypothetical protein
MLSKNKKSMTVAEREHVARIKEMPCAVCFASGPSDAHELEQGQWWTCIPLCRDCHMGSFNGIHGQQRIWKTLKKTELTVLNDVIRDVVGSR